MQRPYITEIILDLRRDADAYAESAARLKKGLAWANSRELQEHQRRAIRTARQRAAYLTRKADSLQQLIDERAWWRRQFPNIRPTKEQLNGEA